jgi:hypothetical protein
MEHARLAAKTSKEHDTQRLRDTHGYRLRAAGVCVRGDDDHEVEVLLVSSRCHPDVWVSC